MIDLLKKYPKLTAALIPNTKTLNPTYGYTEAMEKFQKVILWHNLQLR